MIKISNLLTIAWAIITIVVGVLSIYNMIQGNEETARHQSILTLLFLIIAKISDKKDS